MIIKKKIMITIVTITVIIINTLPPRNSIHNPSKQRHYNEINCKVSGVGDLLQKVSPYGSLLLLRSLGRRGTTVFLQSKGFVGVWNATRRGLDIFKSRTCFVMGDERRVKF